MESLDSLKAACARLGLQFNEGKEDFKWFGRHVGDYPLPEGFTKEDMGKCNHSISVPGKPSAYEVGVCKARDGSGNWELLWDFWGGGYGLQKAIGDKGLDLQEEYATCHAESQLSAAGYIVTREVEAVCMEGL